MDPEADVSASRNRRPGAKTRALSGPPGVRLGDVVEEADGRRRGRPAPGQEGRVEAPSLRPFRLDGLSDRLQGCFLPLEQASGVDPGSVKERELDQQMRADLTDMLNGRIQPVRTR